MEEAEEGRSAIRVFFILTPVSMKSKQPSD